VSIYLDINATTPVDPRVFEAMRPFLTDKFGNASSSTHAYGWVAQEAVEHARGQVAALVGASHPSEIVFTSGATESDNLAILGVVRQHGVTRADRLLLETVAKRYRAGDRDLPSILPARLSGLDLAVIAERGVDESLMGRGDHVVTLATEHPAVLDACRALESEGFRVSYLPVLSDGRVDLEQLERAMTRDTLLVSVMFANNEIGVVQPVQEIGALCHEHGALFFTDAVQAVGKVPVDVESMHIDLLALTAHKMYGPKGVGALFVRRKAPRVTLQPLVFGGGQEKGLRSGTLNVPGIVGLGMACELARSELATEHARLCGLRDRLLAALRAELVGVHMNGHETERVPGNLNLSFDDIDAEALLIELEDVAVSLGSACHSEERSMSHVLKALGVSPERAQGSMRFGLGRFTTEAEVDEVARRVLDGVRKLRELGAP
jgi:cysteine desulfurase